MVSSTMAGIQTAMRPIVDFPEEDFDGVMSVNHRGQFLGLMRLVRRILWTAASQPLEEELTVQY